MCQYNNTTSFVTHTHYQLYCILYGYTLLQGTLPFSFWECFTSHPHTLTPSHNSHCEEMQPSVCVRCHGYRWLPRQQQEAEMLHLSSPWQQEAEMLHLCLPWQPPQHYSKTHTSNKSHPLNHTHTHTHTQTQCYLPTYINYHTQSYALPTVHYSTSCTLATLPASPHDSAAVSASYPTDPPLSPSHITITIFPSSF